MPEDQSTVYEFDFTDAPPVQEMQQFAHVPPGMYHLRVKKLERKQTSTGKPAVSAIFEIATGVNKNKLVSDLFVLPQSSEDNKLGIQRFHGLVIALGGKDRTGQRAKLDLAKFAGRECLSDIVDNEIPASEKYPNPRTGSRPVAFFPVKDSAAQERAKATAEEPAPQSKQADDVDDAAVAATMADDDEGEGVADDSESADDDLFD